MKPNKKKFIAAGIAAVLVVALVVWGICVVRLNRYYRELDEVPIQNYAIGEFLDFGNNYTYGHHSDGYSLRVNSYEILDTGEYLTRYGKTADEYPSAFERVCIVDLTVRYDEAADGAAADETVADASAIDGDEADAAALDDVAADDASASGANTGEMANEGLWLGEIWLYGLDYYAGQNSEFFELENPEMGESRGLILEDGQEYDIRLVFNFIEQYFTKYSWEHMDQLPMMLYLTAYPVQKNIVLQ